MTDYDRIYDPDHRTAAFEEHTNGMLVCLAGPGTGKTFSLLARSHALVARSVPPPAICYLTFIGAIADAFVDDYAQRFGPLNPDQAPRISTLHSLACRLLRNMGYRLGYDGALFFTSISDSDDSGVTFREDLLRFVGREGCRTIPQLCGHLKVLQAAWQNRATPESLPELTKSLQAGTDRLLRAYRLCDFDQAVSLASHLLATAEQPEWLAAHKHYFVDEYQDFNRAEQEVIRQLARSAESVTIVGDDDQSLYSGRGGSPDGMRALVADNANSTVSLVNCYRCKEIIVAHTNAFKRSMAGSERPMRPVTAGGDVRCLRFKSSKAEASYLVDFLATRIAELPETPKSKERIVCLFPTRKILSAYFAALSPFVPCELRVTSTTDARRSVQRLLELVVHPTQRFQQRLVLNDFPEVRPRFREMVGERVLERDTSPRDAVATLIGDGVFNQRASVAAQNFVNLVDASEQQDLAFLADYIAPRTAVDSAVVRSHLEALANAAPGTVVDVIERILDILLPATASPPENSKAVQFLTMHSSKGLTRRVVVLPGLEEACIPGDAEGGEKEEKERLFFVALSRATDFLLLTFPHTRGRGDPLNFAMRGRGEASSFLERAGLRAQYQEA